MAIDPVVYTPIVLCWGAVLYRLPAVLRKRSDRALRAYWVTVVCLASAVTVLVPGYGTINDLLGRPNAARLIGHSLALCAACSVQGFFLHVHDPAEAVASARRRIAVLGAALSLMTALFLLAPVGQETVDFTTRYATAPFVLEYWLVFLGYLGLALATVMRSSWRYAKLAEHVSLGLGLRITSAGGLLGLGYVVNQAVYVLLEAVGARYPGPVEEVSETLLAVSTLLLIGGSTMPSWGPRAGVPNLVMTIRRYRYHRSLGPLWRSLHRSAPEIALGPQPGPIIDAVNPLHLTFRLRRRVIEIRDGCLVLQRYVNGDVLQRARGDGRELGLTAEELTAYVEARALAEGQRRREADEPPGAGVRTADVSEGDLDAEVAHLVQVGRWHRRIVRQGRSATQPPTPDRLAPAS